MRQHHLIALASVAASLSLATSSGCAFFFDDDDDDHHTTSHPDTSTSTGTSTSPPDTSSGNDTAEPAPAFVPLTENRRRPEGFKACVHPNADGSILLSTRGDTLVALDPATLEATALTSISLAGASRVEVWTTPDPRWVWLMIHRNDQLAWELAPLDLDTLTLGPIMTIDGAARIAFDRDAVWSRQRVGIYRSLGAGYDGFRVYDLPADPSTFVPSTVRAAARDIDLGDIQTKAWLRLEPGVDTRWLAFTAASTSGGIATDPMGRLVDLDTPGVEPVVIGDAPIAPVQFHPEGGYLQVKGNIIDVTGDAPESFVPPCSVIAWDGSAGAICTTPQTHLATDEIVFASLDLATRQATTLAHVIPGVAGILDFVAADPAGGRWLVNDGRFFLSGVLAVIDATGPTATWTVVSGQTAEQSTSQVLTVPNRADVWYRENTSGALFRYTFGQPAAVRMTADPVDGLDWSADAERLIVCDQDAARVRSVDPETGEVHASFDRNR